MSLIELQAIFCAVLDKKYMTLDPDMPIIDSGINLDSLTMLRLFTEIEKALPKSIPQGEAFDLFSLSLNQIVTKYSH